MDQFKKTNNNFTPPAVSISRIQMKQQQQQQFINTNNNINKPTPTTVSTVGSTQTSTPRLTVTMGSTPGWKIAISNIHGEVFSYFLCLTIG